MGEFHKLSAACRSYGIMSGKTNFLFVSLYTENIIGIEH